MTKDVSPHGALRVACRPKTIVAALYSNCSLQRPTRLMGRFALLALCGK